MQAQTEPQANPCLSNSSFTKAGSMWEVSSTGISTVSKPHFLNVLKSFVLSLVKGEVNRNVLMPNLIKEFFDRLVEREKLSKSFAAAGRARRARGHAAGLWASHHRRPALS